ncbi:Uncharacterised protein [uncultured archaeon]|nr:Uncharacterised protein [uncultured archaeon]
MYLSVVSLRFSNNQTTIQPHVGKTVERPLINPFINPLTSVYPTLAKIGLPESEKKAKHTFSIHDPCSTRFEREIQDSVRKLIEASGHRIDELEHSRDSTNCFGLGGMAFAVDSDLSAKKAMITIKEAKSDLVTYCASCRGNLAAQGTQVLHVLDLIFNENWLENGLIPPAEPSIAQENQRILKLRLLDRTKTIKLQRIEVM